MSEFLTQGDMKELTGFTHASYQINALVQMGFVRGRDFRVRLDGKPRITWAAVEPQTPVTNQPNFEYLQANKK